MATIDTTPKQFHEIRLSKHFVLSDFLQSPAVWETGLPFSSSDVTEEQIRAGLNLCERLLEPLIDELGPCSVAAGLCPTRQHHKGHPTDSPHFWSDDKGAAADVVFHKWVNEEKPPIKIVEHLHRTQTGFRRVISYAGSEFLCLNFKREKSDKPADHQCMVLENIRIAGQRHKPHYWAKNAERFVERCGRLPDRPDWRRNEHELPSNHKQLRPHHFRMGRFFTLADFCRSPNAYGDGTWMAAAKETTQTEYARMAAEILDPLVAGTGRISVIRGLMPQHLARKEENPSLWTWNDGPAAVEFLLPQNANEAAVRSCLTHPMIEEVTGSSILSGAVLLVKFRPFRVNRQWSSAQVKVQPDGKSAV